MVQPVLTVSKAVGVVGMIGAGASLAAGFAESKATGKRNSRMHSITAGFPLTPNRSEAGPGCLKTSTLAAPSGARVTRKGEMPSMETWQVVYLGMPASVVSSARRCGVSFLFFRGAESAARERVEA